MIEQGYEIDETKQEETVTAPVENSPLPDPSDTVPIDTNVGPLDGSEVKVISDAKDATKEATKKVVEETKEAQKFLFPNLAETEETAQDPKAPTDNLNA